MMRKQLIAAILCVTVLAGCGSLPSQSASSAPPISQSPEQSSQSQTLEVRLTPEQEEAYPAFADAMGREQFMKLCEESGFVPNRVAGPLPDQSIVYYREEFEEPTELWQYSESTNRAARLLGPEELPKDTAIKGMTWREGEGLLILGHRYGTVSPGGNVYRYRDQQLTPFYLCPKENEQVLSMEVSGDTLKLTVALYNENMTDYTTQERSVPLA